MNPQTLRAALDLLAGSTRGLVVGAPPTELRLGYSELLQRIIAAANGFLGQGVCPGDRVIMRVSSSIDDVVAMLAIVYLGAVPVSIKPNVPSTEEDSYVAEVARQQGARYVHGFKHYALHMLDLSQEGSDEPQPTDVTAPDSVAVVQYTSGSTGSPRPVPLTHRALLTDIRGIGSVAGSRPDRIGLVTVPLHHDMGLVGMFSCLVNNIGLYLVETSAFLRRAIPCLEVAAEIGVTETAMPNFLLQFLANRLQKCRAPVGGNDRLLASWETIYCGAEPIRRDAVRAFLGAARPLGLQPSALTFCYGLAEAALLVSAHRYVDESRSFDGTRPSFPACLGRPIKGVEMRITYDNGRDANEGELGNVLIRGDVLFNGYDNATDHRDVWFNTGDLGYCRNGELYLSGRRTDRLVINGANLFVSDIENHVLRSHAASDCVVLPHGKSFAVLVVPARRGEIDTASIAAEIAAAFTAVPTSVIEVPRRSIVRTASGKIARNNMAYQLQRGILR